MSPLNSGGAATDRLERIVNRRFAILTHEQAILEAKFAGVMEKLSLMEKGIGFNEQEEEEGEE